MANSEDDMHGPTMNIHGAPDRPVLGDVITIRKKDGLLRLVGTAMVGGWIFAGLLLSMALDLSPVWLRLASGAPVVLLVAAYATDIVFREVEFRENAVVDKRVFFRRRRIFYYDDVRYVDFSLARQIVNGMIESGTVFDLLLTMADGSSLRVRDNYQGDFDSITEVYEVLSKKPGVQTKGPRAKKRQAASRTKRVHEEEKD